jgi:hypothetical protein
MLRDLFEGTGVMSALDHSKIEGANNPEALNIDAQAARIARRAAAALRQSRAACVVPPPSHLLTALSIPSSASWGLSTLPCAR